MIKNISNDKTKKLIPKPRSRFLRVKCPKCGNTQIIFSHASRTIKCIVCGEVLALPTGGKSKIIGEVHEIFE